MKHTTFAPILFYVIIAAGCQSAEKKQVNDADSAAAKTSTQEVTTGAAQAVELPPPFQTKSVKNFSHVIGWPESKTPQGPAGFTVNKFAGGLDNPRQVYVLPNGDVLAA